jgi:hypothetical protein
MSATTPAQQDRDRGLARLRRLTVWAAVAAAGLTAIASLIAANTIPGRNLGTAQAASSAPAGNGPSSDSGGVAPIVPPGQPPQGGSGNGPAVVSGGS